MRPQTPKFTDHTDPDSYYNLNRYYNEAEKMFLKLERMLPELQRDASPYMGEYYGGQMDLICNILGRERIDWSIDFNALIAAKRQREKEGEVST